MTPHRFFLGKAIGTLVLFAGVGIYFLIKYLIR